MTKKQRPWQLLQDPRFQEDLQRLTAKHQIQVARKIVELTYDPTPGGNKKPLASYPGLYRIRAGDFRIIYCYNANVVQLLTLRRRDEGTYDDLDTLEVDQLREFQRIAGKSAGEYNLQDWEKAALEWAKPKPKTERPLPEPITAAMLEELAIPVGYRPSLVFCNSVEALNECDGVPTEYRCQIMDRLWPAPQAQSSSPQAIPVVSKTDLVEPITEQIAGKLDPPLADGEPMEESMISDADARQRKSQLPAVIKPKRLVIRTSSKESPLRVYPGNTSKGIAKDTRYTAKLDGTVQLRFTPLDDREQALLTTDKHPELIEIVKDAKRFGSASEAGGFVINEFRHVLVPTGKGILFAGRYYRDLEFEFDGNLITPVAPRTIKPGSFWPGPHVGVKYTLTAGAKDLRYMELTKRNTEREVLLTDFHSKQDLADLLAMCRAVKPNGGAIYVNEARELFAPVDRGSGYERRYIGHIGGQPWFPEPV